jgi:hypothetical protein
MISIWRIVLVIERLSIVYSGDRRWYVKLGIGPHDWHGLNLDLDPSGPRGKDVDRRAINV